MASLECNELGSGFQSPYDLLKYGSEGKGLVASCVEKYLWTWKIDPSLHCAGQRDNQQPADRESFDSLQSFDIQKVQWLPQSWWTRLKSHTSFLGLLHVICPDVPRDPTQGCLRTFKCAAHTKQLNSFWVHADRWMKRRLCARWTGTLSQCSLQWLWHAIWTAPTLLMQLFSSTGTFVSQKQHMALGQVWGATPFLGCWVRTLRALLPKLFGILWFFACHITW